jgi:hypothetical protein
VAGVFSRCWRAHASRPSAGAPTLQLINIPILESVNADGLANLAGLKQWGLEWDGIYAAQEGVKQTDLV